MKNYTWQAYVQLHGLGFYPGNGTLTISNYSSTFDPSSGLATFQNLAISLKGMYLLKFSVYTSNFDYKFTCFSQSITILKSTQTLPTYTAGTAPDYLLKFAGNYSAIEPEEVKANVYNFMSINNVGVGGITVYSGSVYVAFYSSDSSSTLNSLLSTSGLTIDPTLKFAYATIFGQTINCTNCSNTIVIIESATTALSNTTVATNNKDQVRSLNKICANLYLIHLYFISKILATAVGAIVGGIVGGLVGILLLALVILGALAYKNKSEYSRMNAMQ